jgi:glycosyltransferase involved in cell wall biosynthesis
MEVDQRLVSIAMASYNGERFIEEQVMSIIKQTYKNIELVIVDDGSKDETVEKILLLQKKYSNIRLYKNEVNLGVTQTFNKAVGFCNGEYIALSDQDDIWVDHKIETLVTAIGDHDAVYGNSELVDADGKSLGKLFSSMMHLESYYSGMPFLLSNTIAGHAILAKGEFLKRIQPFPANLYFDLWIGFNAAGNNGIKYVDEVLVHYRQHSNNAVGTSLSANKRKKTPVQKQFEQKRAELQTLTTASIKDRKTAEALSEMLRLFKRKWSLKRSVFFFKNFNGLLQSKQKAYYRKVLYCVKMIFKPNF